MVVQGEIILYKQGYIIKCMVVGDGPERERSRAAGQTGLR